MKYYKACRNSIVVLKPLTSTINNEKRSGIVDHFHAKFRCNKVRVMSVMNVKTGEKMNQDRSIFDYNFIYEAGKIISTNYDRDINKICSGGIHYFNTKEAALSEFYDLTDNNIPDGKWTGWHSNGQKKYEHIYKNGEYEGKCTNWYDNGQKAAEELYKNGEYEGKCINWYNNGNKEYERLYKNGEREGKWINWYNNGNKEYEGLYKNGEREGKWTLWCDNGNKEYEGLYKDGRWIWWYNNGNKNRRYT